MFRQSAIQQEHARKARSNRAGKFGSVSPTVKAILANRIAPAWIDRYLSKSGYTGQITDIPDDSDAPGNLFTPVPGAYGAHGRFDKQARVGSWEMFTSRHRTAAWAAMFVGVALGVHLLAKRLKV